MEQEAKHTPSFLPLSTYLMRAQHRRMGLKLQWEYLVSEKEVCLTHDSEYVREIMKFII